MKDWIDNQTYFKFEKESSILRMGGGSWTIKPEKITNVDMIVYITPRNKYSISKTMALCKGWILEFKGEKKLVVPLKWWAKNEQTVYRHGQMEESVV